MNSSNRIWCGLTPGPRNDVNNIFGREAAIEFEADEPSSHKAAIKSDAGVRSDYEAVIESEANKVSSREAASMWMQLGNREANETR